MKNVSKAKLQYPKYVQRITGKSERSGRRLLQKIRQLLGKQDHQFVTITQPEEREKRKEGINTRKLRE